MNIKEDIKPISYVKSHAADIIKYINENHRPVIITQNGEAKGVFIDSESYQNMKNTINMMKLIILAENDVAKGQVIEQDKMFKKFDKKFENLQK
ncbi:MAG: type II toxin-antitoxin system Phd/YefM family antitoxin [bacterium]|nr:type II toxin-antitoxin system Phd/YefM family antitoxin [bacterium]